MSIFLRHLQSGRRNDREEFPVEAGPSHQKFQRKRPTVQRRRSGENFNFLADVTKEKLFGRGQKACSVPRMRLWEACCAAWYVDVIYWRRLQQGSRGPRTSGLVVCCRFRSLRHADLGVKTKYDSQSRCASPRIREQQREKNALLHRSDRNGLDGNQESLISWNEEGWSTKEKSTGGEPNELKMKGETIFASCPHRVRRMNAFISAPSGACSLTHSFFSSSSRLWFLSLSLELWPSRRTFKERA